MKQKTKKKLIVSSQNSSAIEVMHAHECKNCSTKVEGPYCSFCGQRYHAHKESFGELVYEFASDFLHFDSRFFKTVLPLLFLPGKMTKSYNEGKQRSQFHPIRLYLFSSFVYFLLLFSFNNPEKNFESENPTHPVASVNDSIRQVDSKDSSVAAYKGLPTSDDKKGVQTDNEVAEPVNQSKVFTALKDSTTNLSLTVTPYIDSLLNKNVSPEQYLLLQKKLAPDDRDGFLRRIITTRFLKINLQGEESRRDFFRKLIITFMHNIPKTLFFLLPVFALLLKLLYYRNKKFYYVDHAVLSLHYFSVIFLMLIICNFILDKIFGTSIFTSLANIWIMLYLLLAMKKLYGQSWSRTIVKYISLGFLFLITVLFTLFANMAISAFIM